MGRYFGQSGVRRVGAINGIANPDVARVFEGYPEPVREKLLGLRRLILETASETEEVSSVEETLKWGEPSYIARGGSTVRIAWKEKRPNQFGLYFNCNTSLVDTFKTLYGNVFTFEGKRAIVFGESDDLPVGPLKHCISLALTYHRIKRLPLLGA